MFLTGGVDGSQEEGEGEEGSRGKGRIGRRRGRRRKMRKARRLLEIKTKRRILEEGDIGRGELEKRKR